MKHPGLDTGVLDAPTGDREGKRFWLAPDLPTDDTKVGRASSEDKAPTPFVMPFWFVYANALDDAEDLESANMTLYMEHKTVGTAQINIPCMKNTKSLKAGAALRIVAPKAEGHPTKRQKTTPQRA